MLPKFYRDKLRNSLGALWEVLPSGALMHDQNAYLKSNVIAKMLKRPASGNLPRSGAAMPTKGRMSTSRNQQELL